MLSDAELTVKFAEATDVAVRNHLFELLWKRHEAFVRESVQAMGSLTPLGYDTHTFLDDVERRVRVKFLLGGLKIYKGRGPFPHFLWKVVKTCALDWRRRITRRSRRETVAARLGGKQTDDTGALSLEQLAFRSGFYCGDPSHLLVHRDRKRIVWAVMDIHASEGSKGAKSGWAVKKAFVSEWKRSRIGKALGVVDRTVRQILAEDLQRLREIFATRFGITDMSQI